MGKWWLLLGGLTLLPLAQAEPPRRIDLVTEQWPGHTNPDGTGLAFDLLRKVYEPAGVELHYRIVPYTRSVGLVQRGEADAFVGAYANEVPQVLFPRWHYDADQISTLGLIDKPVPTLETLGRYRLAWARGYSYQKYLPDVREFREVHRRGGILGMLERGHADFFIDASTEVEDVLAGAARPQDFRITPLTRLPLYLGFVDDARGRELAAIYDRRLQELVRSGALRPLFKRWGAPYPFDKELEKPYVLP